jgi:hypothetical protein
MDADVREFLAACGNADRQRARQVHWNVTHALEVIERHLGSARVTSDGERAKRRKIMERISRELLPADWAEICSHLTGQAIEPGRAALDRLRVEVETRRATRRAG